MPGPDVRCGPISGDQHHSTPLCLFVDRYLLSISRQKDVNCRNRTLCFEMIRGKIVNRKKKISNSICVSDILSKIKDDLISHNCYVKVNCKTQNQTSVVNQQIKRCCIIAIKYQLGICSSFLSLFYIGRCPCIFFGVRYYIYALREAFSRGLHAPGSSAFYSATPSSPSSFWSSWSSWSCP